MQRIVWLLIFFLFGTSVFGQVTEVTELTEEELKGGNYWIPKLSFLMEICR